MEQPCPTPPSIPGRGPRHRRPSRPSCEVDADERAPRPSRSIGRAEEERLRRRGDRRPARGVRDPAGAGRRAGGVRHAARAAISRPAPTWNGCARRRTHSESDNRDDAMADGAHAEAAARPADADRGPGRGRAPFGGGAGLVGGLRHGGRRSRARDSPSPRSGSAWSPRPSAPMWSPRSDRAARAGLFASARAFDAEHALAHRPGRRGGAGRRRPLEASRRRSPPRSRLCGPVRSPSPSAWSTMSPASGSITA